MSYLNLGLTTCHNTGSVKTVQETAVTVEKNTIIQDTEVQLLTLQGILISSNTVEKYSTFLNFW